MQTNTQESHEEIRQKYFMASLLATHVPWYMTKTQSRRQRDKIILMIEVK